MIDRARRAKIKSLAKEIRQSGRIANWTTSHIAEAIIAEISDIRPLEAWRLAHGWSRPEVIVGIAGLYRQAGLRPPALNSSMLCRWEHGESTPSAEYADALCRLYQVPPDQLGLPAPALSGGSAGGAFGASFGGSAGETFASSGRLSGASAVRESVQLAMEAEGPGGGPMTLEQLHQAVRYYDLNYSAFPPSLLASEVHTCRAAVMEMLGHSQSATVRRTTLLLGAWFSALLGNLAFHTADLTGAGIHLSTAAGLATTVDNQRLLSWALGAQSMLAGARGRPRHALDLAVQAVQTADTPLRRAQALAWAQLPALVRLGRGDDARDTIAAVQSEMDASPVPGRPGRFGFDRAELELHLAEAALGLGDPGAVTAHAEEALRQTTAGRPGWVAATLVLAQGSAAGGFPDHGAELALHVLDTIPREMFRSTAWRRLMALDQHLTAARSGGKLATELHERLLARHDRQPRNPARRTVGIPPDNAANAATAAPPLTMAIFPLSRAD
jgi:transcriptional regulator with XRE-family HTH domain